MEKTPQEIEASVLAFCDNVCPDTYKPYIDDDGCVSIWRKLKWNLEPYFEVTASNETTVLGVDATNWKLFYRLLGLDKRDALEAAREKITTLEQQLEEAQNVKFEGMASPAWAMLGELTKFMEQVVDSDVPRTMSWCARLEDGEHITLMNIWAATSHDSPITRATELRDLLDAEKEKSMRWESRAWKILQIVRRPSHRSRPKTAAVLRTLREVSEKNERLVEELTKIARLQHASYRSEVEAMKGIALNAIEAYKEGKKDE